MDITVATLVYKSPTYLDFVLDSLKKNPNKLNAVEYLVVANDATDEIKTIVDGLNFKTNTISCRGVIHDNKDPNEWWIQRVYSAWNRCIEECDTEYICFVNNDMAFTPGWLDALAKYNLSKYIPTSRLVESERMPSLPGLISKNFGQTLATFQDAAFQKFAEGIKGDGATAGVGAYMPSLFKVDTLKLVGGWHKNVGNLPGDRITFALLKQHLGMDQIMVHDSIVYHFQRGESVEVGDA